MGGCFALPGFCQMKVKIKDLSGFQCNVFGADCFLEYWPEIKTTGIEVQLFPAWGNTEHYYVMRDGKKVNDTAFFSLKEMQYLEEVLETPSAH